MASIKINKNISPKRTEVIKTNFLEDFNNMIITDVILPTDVVIQFSWCDASGVYGKLTDFSSLMGKDKPDINSVDCIKWYITNNGTEIATVSFILGYEVMEVDRNVVENRFVNSINIKALGDVSKQIEKDLNLYINTTDGICVTYYRTEPNGTDSVLREYNGHKFIEKTDLNLLFPDNALPSLEDMEISEWGSQFQTYEATLDWNYYQSIFGCDIDPREEDYLLVHEIRTLFKVSSAFLMRGINGEPTYWKLTLSKFEDDVTVDREDDGLDEMIVTGEKLFGDVNEDEYEDVLNIKQTMDSQIYRDINRCFVSEDVVIGDNNYNMYGGTAGDIAVTYNDEVSGNFNVSFIVDVLEPNIDIMKIGESTISVALGKLVIFGFDTGVDVLMNEKFYFSANFSEGVVSVQFLQDELDDVKEIYYNDCVELPVVLPSGEVSLLFGSYEIERLRIFKKHLPREITTSVMTRKTLDKPSIAFIIDDCEDVNNNPRSGEKIGRAHV